jgi:hypothetical protein
MLGPGVMGACGERTKKVANATLLKGYHHLPDL